VRGSFLWRNRIPLQAAAARFSDGARSLVDDYLNLLDVRQENLRLKAELARFTSERIRMAELEIQNQHLRELVELRDALGAEAIAARVIGSDATGLSRTIVLGEGSAGGLKPGMAVVSNQGVVGKVIATSPHAARVLLIDDHNSAVDGFDQRTRARGIVAGLIDNGLIMKYVDRSRDVRSGDPVVTSGLDGIFPRGLLIGWIKTVHREGPGLFVAVTVTPAVEFRALEQVLVLRQPPARLDGEFKG
jgi:rod shape-determining protein MreC